MTTACLFEKKPFRNKIVQGRGGKGERDTERETEREGEGGEGEYYYNITLEHNTHVIFTIYKSDNSLISSLSSFYNTNTLTINAIILTSSELISNNLFSKSNVSPATCH